MSASLAFPETARLLAQSATSGNWRTFEVTTRVEILKFSGATRVWPPAPLIGKTPYQKTLSNEFTAAGGTARIVEGSADALGIIAAEFPAGVKPVLTLTSRVATRNYAVDLSAHRKAPKAARWDLEHFLRPTKLLPIDGIVKATATEITTGAATDLEKARAIYEWIVENTFRNPKTRGCGIGDIRFMLESRDLGGKCADLNALFVGLARASGLPARATCMESASPNQNLDTRASAPHPKTSPNRSTAAPKYTSTVVAGFLSIPRMCGKLCSKNHPEIGC
jgi:transglutaminase-like putative cysteine protease